MVDVLHGVAVPDPYRWLEDGEAAEVIEWAAAQNARTRAVLDALPGRARLRDVFLDLLRTGAVSASTVAGDRVFTLERSGDQDQAVVVMRSAVEGGKGGAGGAGGGEPPRVVVDPHDQADDHAAAIDWFSPSPDGRYVAYGVSQAGSEHGVLRIVDVDGNRLLDDAIEPVRHPQLAWLPDGSAFAYSRLPSPGSVPPGDEGYWEKIFWHVVGTAQADDDLLLGAGDELERTALPWTTISRDGRWLVFHVHLMPTRTDIILFDRRTGRRQVIIEGEEAMTSAWVVGDYLYATTTYQAPRGRVVRASLGRCTAADWDTVVPESSAVIDAATVTGAYLLVATTEHAVSRLWRYGLGGSNPTEIPLPEHGAITGLDSDEVTPRAFLTFTSFTRSPALFRWTLAGGLEPWSHHPSPVDPSRYRVEQVFYESTDGAKVPMFLVSAATTKPGPGTPTVLYGYGGFAITSTPAFSPGIVTWCEAGGVFADAGIRGGGEYGEDWHRAGMLHHKQQSFDDFIAAADWLVANGRTSRAKLALRGGSNGGLLVGAVATQRPDLCQAVVCAVPLLDMLRYHLFLIGALWVPEYGDPADPDDFAVLHAYSPYHRLVERAGVEGTDYPAMLVMTAESDSRVDPMHARKFAAALQAAGATETLLRVESRAGHGQGKPRWKQAEELADAWAFSADQLGLKLDLR